MFFGDFSCFFLRGDLKMERRIFINFVPQIVGFDTGVFGVVFRSSRPCQQQLEVDSE